MAKTKVVALVMVVLMTASAFSAVPMTVFGGDVPTANLPLNNGMDIFARPPVSIVWSYLGYNTTSPTNGTYLANKTTTQIDVMTNYTFTVKLQDQDFAKPNITFMRNVTLVAFVSFEKDPTAYKPGDFRAKYNHRNYEFQFNATRTSGGGNTPSIWNLTMNYPTIGPDAEVKFNKQNSTWVNETDKRKAGGAFGADGTNDTIELRWNFRLGPQCRNTNATGTFQMDDWFFYVEVRDTLNQVNSSKGRWPQRFDVFQRTAIFGGGSVAGSGVPGGGAFLLDIGMDPNHLVHYSANNNVTFYVNATNLTGSWLSSTLRVAGENLGTGDTEWITLGPGFKYLAQANHTTNGTNGTRSYLVPGPGEFDSGTLYWMCTGIPMGIASGKYNSTVTYKIKITGT